MAGLVLVAGSCLMDFDELAPVTTAAGGGSASTGGSAASNSGAGGQGGAGGGATTTLAGPGSGGAGGSGNDGGGGATSECVGQPDDTLCGSLDDSDCDPLDTCQDGVCQMSLTPDDSACDDCAVGFCKGCMSGSCVDCSVVDTDLETLFTGLSSTHGNMFDITALETLRVYGYSLNLTGSYSGTVEVYRKLGGIGGDPQDMTGWALIGIENVNAAGAGNPTYIDMTSNTMRMEAGETVGIYLTTISALEPMRYTASSGSVGDIADSNSHLEIRKGYSMVYPFGTVDWPKLWNGTVHYEACE